MHHLVGMTLPSAPRHLLASALLPEMAQRFRVTSSTMVRAAIPTPGTAPVTGRYTRSERVHCLRIGCSTHTHKRNRGPNRYVRRPQHNESRPDLTK